MSTYSHEPLKAVPESRPWVAQLLVREMWAALAIIVMWLAVLFDALYGPDIVTSSGAGTNTSSVPSAVAVALFATIATWVVARYGFGGRRNDAD